MREHLEIKENHLYIGGVDCVKLADEFGTPLYVMDENRIRHRYREIYDAFSRLYPKVEIKYSYKANTSLAILHILRQEGAGADVVSEGELYIALNVGIEPEKIFFTGNNKTDRELGMALEAGVIINIDSLHELERLKRICESEQKKAKISFRVNPDISPETHPHLATGLKESKFGIQMNEAISAYKKAAKCKFFSIEGIHMHIGSQITSVSPYKEATYKLLDLVGKLHQNSIELNFIDLGGGIGIKYKEDAPSITPRELAENIVPIVKNKLDEYGLGDPTLILEPGRYIVGDAGILLTRVTTIKKGIKKFIGVDSGFNILIRPVMYQAYHEVVVANKMTAEKEETVDIAGNLCESGDIIAKNRFLPKIEEGDIIAILDTGAYGIVMSSRYNSRPLPAEVLVCDGKYELIRKREGLHDLLAKQIVPVRLLK